MDPQASTLPLIYRGSVKDLLGPVASRKGPAVVFEYSDAYSVFDWGRMPDELPGKGRALAVMAADFFERLEDPKSWRDFSRSQEALALRKHNPFGVEFIELGETLQASGLKTHYLGVGREGLPLSEWKIGVPNELLVRQVAVSRPRSARLLGREVCDYSQTWSVNPPKLVPLEVVFRFSAPHGSSLLERLKQDPSYLDARGFSGVSLEGLEAGKRLEFPILELFTKLESTDRPLTLEEAAAICGIPIERLGEVLFRTAWVAAFLKWRFAEAGLELADGKLEWAVDESGQPILVDAIGPDELRLLHRGVHLSKEFLRAWYRGTAWYEAVQAAKSRAPGSSSAWKKGLPQPQALPASHRELASQLYRALANRMTGRPWFPEAWSLEKVLEALEGSVSAGAGS